MTRKGDSLTVGQLADALDEAEQHDPDATLVTDGGGHLYTVVPGEPVIDPRQPAAGLIAELLVISLTPNHGEVQSVSEVSAMIGYYNETAPRAAGNSRVCRASRVVLTTTGGTESVITGIEVETPESVVLVTRPLVR